MRSLDRVERYGLVSLVFLVTTIVAVTLWDAEPREEDDDPAGGVAHAAAPGGAEREAPRSNGATPRTGPELTQPRPGGPTAADDGNPTGGGGRRNGRNNRAGGPSRDDVLPAAPFDPPPFDPPSVTPDPEPEVQLTSVVDLPGPPVEPTPDPPRSEPVASGGSGSRSPIVRAQPGRGGSHEVQPGESLSQISLDQLGTSKRYLEIAALNGIPEPYVVKVGQVLQLPARGATPPPTTPPSPGADEDSDASTLVVQEGDSYWRIAARALGDATRFGELEDLNPGVPSERLRPGMRIVVPAGARTDAPAPPRSEDLIAARTPDEDTEEAPTRRRGVVR